MDCPYCAAGNKPRIREETGELVHDFVTQISAFSRRHSQTICHDDPKWKAKQEKLKNG
jgi:hypothetical protein